MSKKSSLLCILFSAFLLISCATGSSFGGFAKIGGTIAAAAGLIDDSAADSIVKAGMAIDSAAEEITPQQEYYIGRAVAATLLTSYRPLTDERLRGYLNEVCRTIVINSKRPELYKGYFVQILDSHEINAFATSGGHILVTRGLLECAENEDALAAVIAHEIAHIQLGHGLRAIKTSRTAAAITATASAGFSASGVDELQNLASAFDAGISDIIHTLVNSGYSQSQEFEADALALFLLEDAGYAPQAMLDMLDVLEQKSKRTKTGFAKTHPKPADRITHVHEALIDFPHVPVDGRRTARFQKNILTS